MSLSSPPKQRFILQVAIIWIGWMTICSFAADPTDNNMNMNSKEALRQDAKPWPMRNLIVFGIPLPISPTTLIVVLIAVVNWVYNSRTASSSCWAEASHILVVVEGGDSSNATQKMLLDLKTNQIGNNAHKFSEMARKYSTCPSKQQGGDLGKFQKNTMAPPFDQIVFDPASPLLTTLGPVQTQFGWHLIYIRKRNIG